MKSAPWFKMWASDYMTDRDVDELPLEAQAILTRIWCVQWLEGGIPSDPHEIARKIRVSVLHVQKHMQNLIQFFYEDASGLLMSERMEAERSKSKITSKSRSESAKSRWNKTVNAFADANDDAKPYANSHAKTMLSESESESDIKTPSAHKPRGPKSKTPSAATRHSRLQLVIMNWYRDWAGAECPWDGGEGSQLAALLKSTPGWLDQQFITCLDNLARSDCVAKGDRPREWLARLPKFLNAPLDKFKNPKGVGNGSGNSKASARDARNLAAVISAAMGPEVRGVYVPDGETVPDRADSRAQRPDDPR